MRKKGEKQMDITEAMKKRRDELLAQKEKIDRELKGVGAYLKAVGVIEGKKRRGRKPKEGKK